MDSLEPPLDPPLGIDGIHPDVFKHCAAPLIKPSIIYFVTVYQTMTYRLNGIPTVLLPYLNLATNTTLQPTYRPISLLFVTSKVLERLVLNFVIGYLTKHLSNQQFNFMTGHSLLQQLLLFYEYHSGS